MKVQVVYITQVRVEEWVELDGDIVKDAGPMLRIYKGRPFYEIRSSKMVTKVREVPPPEPKPEIVLTDKGV